jgi:hypothetical protein
VLRRNGDRKPLATLLAAAREDFATPPGGHTGAEPVLVDAAPIARTI